MFLLTSSECTDNDPTSSAVDISSPLVCTWALGWGIGKSSYTERFEEMLKIWRQGTRFPQLFRSKFNSGKPRHSGQPIQRMLAVGQFDKEASQTRDYCGAKSATSRGSPRSFAAQKALTQDDNQTDPLPRLLAVGFARCFSTTLLCYLAIRTNETLRRHAGL
jgi:hypothetical protein